jgi:hypothetical protein
MAVAPEWSLRNFEKIRRIQNSCRRSTVSPATALNVDSIRYHDIDEQA